MKINYPFFKDNINPLARKFLPFFVVLVFVFGGLYIGCQQLIRQTANLEPLEAVRDAGTAISNGVIPTLVSGNHPVDLKNSASVFLQIFDEKGNLISGSARLDGQSPLPPKDVFAKARKSGQNRFSWQPQKGVREAVVLMHIAPNKGFVLSGVSLSEPEKLANRLGWLFFAIWLFANVFTLASLVFVQWWYEYDRQK